MKIVIVFSSCLYFIILNRAIINTNNLSKRYLTLNMHQISAKTTKDQKVLLTGTTPSGTPHVGNYIGAIKPALEMARQPELKSYFFIADYHSLIKLWEPRLRRKYIYEMAATWLSLGLDINRTVFYRQSDIPEILEVNWILTSVTAKGLLNRSHAYKAILNFNQRCNQKYFDTGVTMGLFNYPMLMAADIITFNADLVPVGKDQIQHIEIARDIVNRFNNIYQTQLLKVPEAVIDDKTLIVKGLDGQKMSKSHNNTIPLFCNSKQLHKLIMSIVTNSQPPAEPKSIKNCIIFSLYQKFADPAEVSEFSKFYQQGISWRDAKFILFEKMDKILSPARQQYEDLLAHPEVIDIHLNLGAEKARMDARKLLTKIKTIIGL